MNDRQLLHLLQLSSPALPVGAYSYSEGLEYLVEKRVIENREQLCSWIEQELRYGSIRTETAVMARAYYSVTSHQAVLKPEPESGCKKHCPEGSPVTSYQ